MTENDISIQNEDEELYHYGMPRRSGRYPWGSGENPYQHSGQWLARVNELKSQGFSETEIAEAMGLKTTELRAAKTIALEEKNAKIISDIKELQAKGITSATEIAEKLGLPGESSVRHYLKQDINARTNIARNTADKLKELCDERGMIDVGSQSNRALGVSPEKMNAALEILKMEGYEVHGGKVPQPTNKGQLTTIRVLCPPGTPWKETLNFNNIHSVKDYTSDDGGDTFRPSFQYPASMDSKRIMIQYGDKGGKEKDGVVEIRRGVPDLSLGESHYAQVRILVDGTHYIKGMAVYADDLPPGIDVRFNTNKPSGTPMKDVLKKIKDDPTNPFGSSIKEEGGQSYWTDENGETHLSLINKRSDQGDWGEWSKELPSQFLSKQPMGTIRKQLRLALAEKEDEYADINRLTNPTVRRYLLEDFAEDCDAGARELKAAAFPGQRYQVILPLISIKDNEVYAPNFTEGQQIALIRYPHGGTFEIPILTVNNHNKEGERVIGKNGNIDAVGISSSTAEMLSGADFDGDTVMVIPLNSKVNVKNSPRLITDFDNKLEYGPDPSKTYTDEKGKTHYIRGDKEIRVMNDGAEKQREMGIISNLITDMTLQGATREELARAVKHSMVVIDAPKHKLDYKQSEIDNDIQGLKREYQIKRDSEGNIVGYGGASTLVSMAKSVQRIPDRKEGAYFAKDTGNELILLNPEERNHDNYIFLDNKTGKRYTEKEKETRYVDPVTGAKLYRDTGEQILRATYKDKNGKTKTSRAYIDFKDPSKLYYKTEDGDTVVVTNEKITAKPVTIESHKMDETPDARILSSGTPQEEAYAEYANRLKTLANKARKDALFTKDIPYSPSANKIYKNQVESLTVKLNAAQENTPKERLATMIAASELKAYTKENPNLTDEEKRKKAQNFMTLARARIGAKKPNIVIEPEEWKAIQAGAISSTKLKTILSNVDKSSLLQQAMPMNNAALSSAKVNRIKALAESGHTNDEIAKIIGVSSSTIVKYLSGKE